MISLQLCSIMISYCVSISSVLYRRLQHPISGTPDAFPSARWSLGKWGVPINSVAVAYSAFAFFWSFWPAQTPVDRDSLNYAVVIFVGVFIVALGMYGWRGRFAYRGPVSDVEHLPLL
jgi:choline transport protein